MAAPTITQPNSASGIVLPGAGGTLYWWKADGTVVHVNDTTPLPVTATLGTGTFPAAAALADNSATPTTTAVGAFGMVYDGATWDFQRGTAADGTLVNLGTNNDVVAGGFDVSVQGTLNTAAPVIAAAGNYDAGDVLSNDADAGEGDPFIFLLGRNGNGGGVIVRAVITCSVGAMVPRLRLWLFKDTPTTTEMDDNAAFNLTTADRALLLGYIDFPALTDIGDVSFAQNLDVRLQFSHTDTQVFGILQTLDAFTNESAGMTMTIELGALQS